MPARVWQTTQQTVTINVHTIRLTESGRYAQLHVRIVYYNQLSLHSAMMYNGITNR